MYFGFSVILFIVFVLVIGGEWIVEMIVLTCNVCWLFDWGGVESNCG